MLRVRISRLINVCLGGRSDRMLSSRVHAEHITWAITFINFLFGSADHCRLAYDYDVKEQSEMARPVAICPKCRVARLMVCYHTYPLRFFKKKNNIRFYLCRTCHDDLEKTIPQHQKLTKERYVVILLNFLQDSKPRN